MRVEYEPSGPPQEVAPGLFMALPGKGKFSGMELDGALYDVEMLFHKTPHGVRPMSVTVTSHDSAVPITGTALRALRVWDAARSAIVHGVDREGYEPTQNHPPGMVMEKWGLSDQKIEAIRKQGPTSESLEWVAFLYNLAEVLGYPPTKQVETVLGLPRATASNWVRRARDKDLLPPVRVTSTRSTTEDAGGESNA